jgi:hypothetical protein
MTRNPASPRFLEGTVYCPYGAAIGGGIQFYGPIDSQDTTISSYPFGGRGWRATAYSASGHTAVIHVMCVSL